MAEGRAKKKNTDRQTDEPTADVQDTSVPTHKKRIIKAIKQGFLFILPDCQHCSSFVFGFRRKYRDKI